MICERCGHDENLHFDGSESRCSYHDADGPCLCTEFVPCSHKPASIVFRDGALHATCVCGQVTRPLDIDAPSKRPLMSFLDGLVVAPERCEDPNHNNDADGIANNRGCGNPKITGETDGN